MARFSHRLALTVFLLVAVASPAVADPFDLIYADQIDLTLCSDGCGITLAGVDFGLIVNTGAVAIDAPAFFGTTFAVTSSNPALSLTPFINNPGPVITPILPGEVVGSVQTQNQLLTALIEPNETFRNTQPLQVIAFKVERTTLDPNPYVGPVHFDVAMQVGSDTAFFPIDVDLQLGPHAIAFTHAARVHSNAGPTATRVSTWGRLKQLYR
jgi:hypothetical protein